MGFGGNNWGDPNSMAWLGAAQALGQAAMPSRMPVPNGAVFGALAGGLMQGAKSGYDMKQEQMKTLLLEAQAAEAKRKTGVLGQVLGMAQNLEKMFGGTGSDLTPGDGTIAAPVTSDTSDPGIVPNVASGPTSFSPAPDKSNFASGLRRLTDLGVHPDVAAGAVSYMDRNENGFNSLAVNPSSGALGRAQWLGSRKSALVAQHGNRPSDEQQADFMVSELLGPEKGVLDRLLAAKSSKEGYDIWGTHYERPGAAALAKAGVGGAVRGRPTNQIAQQWAAAGTQGAPYAPEVPPETSGSGSLQEQLDAKTLEVWRTQGKEAAQAFYQANRSGLQTTASRQAPVNAITPLASGAAPVAPLSLAPGVPAAPVGVPAMPRSGPLLSPQAMALAKAESMAQLAGLGDIFKPWASAYYGSPAQKAEVAAATTRATQANELPFVGPREAAKRGAAELYDNRAALLKADLDARNAAAKAALDLANADMLAGRQPGPGGVIIGRPGQSEVDAAKKGAEAKAEADARASVTPQSIIVTLPDGSQVERQVTQKQYAEMVAGAPPVAAAPGRGLVSGGAAPGAPSYGKPVGMGQIPDGYRLIIPPEGGPARLERVPGSPGAQAAEQQEGAKQQAADVVSQEIMNGLKLSNAWTTGIGGAIFKGIPGSAAHDLQSSLDTIKANVGFDRLQVMRNGSATGGALGPVSDVENRLLQSTLGSLEQSQSREQFEKNLRRLHEVYQDIVHGAPADLQKAVKEGKLSKVQYDGVMERRKTAREAADLKPITADIKADVDGAIARGAPRDAVIQRLRDRGYDTSKF